MEQQLIDAITVLKDAAIDELILDLRYNGGGYLDISAELGTMIVGDTALGAIYKEMIFNDKLTSNNQSRFFPSIVYGFSATIGATLPKLNLSKIYILSTGNTASASEALINGLRGIDVEVILIGEPPLVNPMASIPQTIVALPTLPFSLKVPMPKALLIMRWLYSEEDNGTDQVVGCRVADDLGKALGDANENMLSTALHHIQNSSCPWSLWHQLANQLTIISRAWRADKTLPHWVNHTMKPLSKSLALGLINLVLVACQHRQ